MQNRHDQGELPPAFETQLDKEMALLWIYKDTPMQPVLEGALTQLKQFSGIGIPRFQHPTNLEVEYLDGGPDDIGRGFIELGSLMGSDAGSAIRLMPKTKNERPGLVIEAENLPSPARRLLDDLYNLTDAKLVRKQRYGNTSWFKGEYHATPLYFCEHHNTYSPPNFDEKQVFINRHSADIVGNKGALRFIDDFTAEDQRKITEARQSARQLWLAGVTHELLDSHLELIKEMDSSF